MFIAHQQLKYIAHVLRSNNTIMTKKLTFENINSKKRGRSHKTLLLNVAKNLNTDINHLCKMALDRCF